MEPQLVQRIGTPSAKQAACQQIGPVLDDAWNIRDVRALDMVGPNGALVITTRNEGLVRRFGTKENGLSMLELNHAAGGAISSMTVRSRR